MSVTKNQCRPKSALRRKAVQSDRQQPQDLDLTEGEIEQFWEVEQCSTVSTNRIQSKTEVNQGNSESKI